ncbi:hypothetical protein Tco_0089768 [Tanacetum coccineum]
MTKAEHGMEKTVHKIKANVKNAKVGVNTEEYLRIREVPLLELTRGRVVPLGANVQAAGQGGGENIVLVEDEVSATIAEQTKKHPCRGGWCVTVVATVPFITSFVTPDSIFCADIRTRHPSERFVISLDSVHDLNADVADDEFSSVVRSVIPDPLIMTATIFTTVIADIPIVLVPKARSELVWPTPFADSVTTGEPNFDTAGPFYTAVAELHGMDYYELFVEFNVGTARQTCLSSEIRLQLEHELRSRKKFDDKCVMQDGWLKERDAEIATLKAQLSLREAEAAKAIRLHGQIVDVEAMEATRVIELNALKERNAALKVQVAALEFAAASKDVELAFSNSQVSRLEATCSDLCLEVAGYKVFKEQIEAVQDEQVRLLSDHVAGLDAQPMEMALHMDEGFYPRFLTTIAGRRWLLTHGLRLVVMKCLQLLEYIFALGEVIGHAIDKGMQDGLAADIDHGKARRSLANVAAYSPFAEANFVLLLMPFVIVRGEYVSQQVSLADALVPLLEPLYVQNLAGEASTSGAPIAVTTTTLLLPLFRLAMFHPFRKLKLLPLPPLYLRRKSWIPHQNTLRPVEPASWTKLLLSSA